MDQGDWVGTLRRAPRSGAVPSLGHGPVVDRRTHPGPAHAPLPTRPRLQNHPHRCEAMIRLATIDLTSRRLARKPLRTDAAPDDAAPDLRRTDLGSVRRPFCMNRARPSGVGRQGPGALRGVVALFGGDDPPGLPSPNRGNYVYRPIRWGHAFPGSRGPAGDEPQVRPAPPRADTGSRSSGSGRGYRWRQPANTPACPDGSVGSGPRGPRSTRASSSATARSVAVSAVIAPAMRCAAER